MKLLMGGSVLLIALALGGCAAPEQLATPASAAPIPKPASVIVLTAENMNAHSSIAPLDDKLGGEVLSVANLLATKLEARGQVVVKRNYKQASPQDVARIIGESKGASTRLLQVYWTADDKNYIHLVIDSLPITYAAGTARMGSNTGTRFEIVGPGSGPRKTAEEMAEAFLKSQGG